MKDENVRSLFKSIIKFSFFVIIFLYVGDVKSQEGMKIAKPTITQYPNVQMEILYTATYRIEDIFECHFYDPTNDSIFMQHLERNIGDISFRKTVLNNHYGTIISFSTPDHPSGSDTVFFPSKDTTICNALKKAKVISINNISCIGDHYPPCWLGIGGLVKEVCTEQNIKSCGEISKLEPPPKNDELFFNFGQESLQEGEYDQAISDFSMAIEENPKYFQAFNGRGIAYYRKGQYNKAISDYNKALEIDPKNAHAFKNLGTAYFKLNNKKRSCANYQKACELGLCGELEQAKKEGHCK